MSEVHERDKARIEAAKELGVKVISSRASRGEIDKKDIRNWFPTKHERRCILSGNWGNRDHHAVSGLQ